MKKSRTRPDSVNELLRALRENSGVTQMEAAQFLGHSTAQYISNLERCLCDPSVEMALRLNDFYGGSRSNLYDLMLSVHQKNLKEIFGRSRRS